MFTNTIVSYFENNTKYLKVEIRKSHEVLPKREHVKKHEIYTPEIT